MILIMILKSVVIIAYMRGPWDVCPGEYRLCDSCHTIIKNRIHKPFTKSKSELIYDSILLQEQMNNVLERLAKLEANIHKKTIL